MPLYACLERQNNTKQIASYSYQNGAAFIIGPEGGFDESEAGLLLSAQNIHTVHLGNKILRAETAAIACLSYARLSIAL